MKSYLEQLRDYLAEHDRLLATSLYTTEQMNKSEAFSTTAEELLAFIVKRHGTKAFTDYIERNNVLMKMQMAFDKAGKYSASTYSEVTNVDRDLYNLSLLMSFFVANHRYEILQHLTEFFKKPLHAPQTILSVGVGTGYEVKVMQENLKDWQIDAYDISTEAIQYASELLDFFSMSSEGLKTEHFPLENKEGVGLLKSKYGKIVLCEVLEHLENPLQAIKNLKEALHPHGRIFLTMAVNIAQEDHIYLYSSAEQAKAQVLAAGLEVEEEWITPMTLLPFAEEDRQKKFKKGNYICVAKKATEN